MSIIWCGGSDGLAQKDSNAEQDSTSQLDQSSIFYIYNPNVKNYRGLGTFDNLLVCIDFVTSFEQTSIYRI